MSDHPHPIQLFESAMRARSVAEWIGKTPESAIPERVKVRVYLTCDGRCIQCQRKLRPGDKAEIDHVISLINGGENRETNLQLMCGGCHKLKTRGDVATKSKIKDTIAKHMGFRKPKRKIPYRRLNGTPVW